MGNVGGIIPGRLWDPDAIPEDAGCADLRNAILRVRPKLHVCGHIHVGHGKYQLGETMVVNASICNEAYDPVNPPIVVDL
jgi:Icc-related predicted phosphoesterase